MLSINKCRVWSVSLFIVALVVLIGCWRRDESKRIRFQSLNDVREFAQSKGLHVVDAGPFRDQFFVIEKPVPISRLWHLRKNRCGLTPEWKGVVWVISMNVSNNAERGPFIPEAVGGRHRIWGNVLAAGDEQLLNRIERLYLLN